MSKRTTIQENTTQRHLKKYNNKNPIHKYTLGRFFDRVAVETSNLKPHSTLEFGCGEGLFLEELKKRNIKFNHLTGIDLRQDAIDCARDLLPEYTFQCIDLFDFQPREKFDLVIVSQVLEHLLEPGVFMERLVVLSDKHLLLTVPWEPWFQLMNFIRGRDFLRLGNHPEHVNRWTANGFRKFVSKYVTVCHTTLVFPFIILIAEVPS